MTHRESSPASAIDTAQAYGAGVVAQTRLTPPPARPGLLHRVHLSQRLAHAGPQKLTLLAAPAGFGKTTLLTQWMADLPQNMLRAWLVLDESDNDSGQFVQHLVAALQRARPGLGQMALAALLHAGQAADNTAIASLLINDLIAVGEPFVVVLDDYHLITTPAIHDLTAFVLDYAPPTLHLVIACRTDPPLPLARLRARGDLVELRTADLRLSAAEAEHLVEQSMGQALPPAHLALLYERTEGWAAGLHLAALALQRQPDQQQALASFSGQHHFVLDYVVDEVVHHLPPHLAAFLGQTAILSRLCAPLCDAVTQRTDSHLLLHELAQAHLFLEPLDTTYHWYRCPPLFAEALRAQFQTAHPDQIAGMHLRASAWYAQHDFADQAVSHALAAGVAEQAAHLVAQSFLTPLMRGDGSQVLSWLRALPVEVVNARPRLWLAAATAWIIAGQYTEADPWLTRLAEAAPDPDATGLYEMLQAHNAYYHGDLTAAIVWARAALAHKPPATIATLERQVVIPATTVILSSAELMQGQADIASETLHQALRHIGPTVAPEQHVALSMLAALHIRLADVCYERDDLAAAARHAQEASDLAQQSGYLAYHAYGLALLARVQQARGQPNEAQARMRQAEHIMAVLGVVDDITYTVLGWSLQLAISRQDAAAVEEWEQMWARRVPHADATDELPPVFQQISTLLQVRRHLFRQEIDAALHLLAELRRQAEAVGLTRMTIEILVLHALASQARLHTRQAIETLAQALTLAERGGFVRLIADEGAALALLLAQVGQRGQSLGGPPVSQAYLDRLLAVCATPPHTPTATPATTELDALSAREQEVLRLLAAGLSNAEIAERLVVTPGTVKRHLHNLYSKLGVANRTQAAAYARAYLPE